jgi:hypothetical protein
MGVSHIEIRPLRSDERAAWEPLWKGYQPIHYQKTPLKLFNFLLCRPHLNLR